MCGNKGGLCGVETGPIALWATYIFSGLKPPQKRYAIHQPNLTEVTKITIKQTNSDLSMKESQISEQFSQTSVFLFRSRVQPPTERSEWVK